MNKEETTGLIFGLILMGIAIILNNQILSLILAGIYLVAIIGLFKAMKMEGLQKAIPINLWSTIFMVGFLGIGLLGVPSLGDVADVDFMPDEFRELSSGVGDLVVHPNYWNNGSDYAESGSYYHVNPALYTDHYQALQVYIDEGAAGLRGPDGNAAQVSTVSSGSVTFSDVEVVAGQNIGVVYIYDSTPAAAEWPCMLWKDIVVSAPDDDDSDNNHKLTGSVLNIARLGTLDSYNYEATDITGYKYKGSTTTAESNKEITFDARPTTEGDVIRDMYVFVETDSTSDAQIDHITIAGTTYAFSSWIPIDDASSTWKDTKESKQATTNNLYAVATVPLMEYISSTAGTPDRKGQVEMTVQYDFPSMAVNNTMMFYVYGVCEGAGGSDMHYSAAANPLFTYNGTTDYAASTAWTT